MSSSSRAIRGASLLLVMIVLLTMTLLVAGAISFTSSERSAAAVHTRTAVHSSCAQAARNLFLSRLRVLQRNIKEVQLNDDVSLSDGRQMHVALGHYSGAGSITFTDVNRVRQLSGGMADLTNRLGGGASGSPGGASSAGQYSVHAVCREPDGTEQEVEFAIAVSF